MEEYISMVNMQPERAEDTPLQKQNLIAEGEEVRATVITLEKNLKLCYQFV